VTTVVLALFWISALLLVHVYIGYPLCMWLLARWRSLPVQRQAATPTVTIIMAVHDGVAWMSRKLANLSELNYPHDHLEVVIVCDGCTDETARLCRDFSGLRVHVLEFEQRRGKAACLNDAVDAAEGEVLLMTDVRQRLNPESLRELVADLSDPTVGAVSGELCLIDAKTGFARSVDAYWRYEKMIRQAESSTGSMIGVTGALYALRRTLYQPLPEGTVLDDVLIPMRVAAAGWRVIFEPRALAWDQPSAQPEDERRRKIRTLAGNYQLVQLAPWLLQPWSNPLWFRFVSHKLLRLLAPWLILVVVAASVLLVGRHFLYSLTLLACIGGVGLVALGRLRPAWAQWMPVRLATAFWYLNLFAAEALFRFARNRRLHLW
jgi:cellulose synthase/poly-beta-1,6-N-acetylglucosamine synthase-like glycosyltransferase